MDLSGGDILSPLCVANRSTLIKMNKNFLYPSLLFTALILLFISCSKDDLSEWNTPAPNTEQAPTSALLQSHDAHPQPLPDLVTSIITNVTAMTNNCGHTIPDVSCYGQHTFRAAAIVENVGVADLPPGNISVEWTINNGDPRIQTVAHNGIPSGRSIRVKRIFDLGDCDCGHPPAMSFQAIFFGAKVDPNDRIPERREDNNEANPFLACNGC